VRELLRVVRADAEVALADAVAAGASDALLDPVPIPLGRLAGGTKNSISICSNSSVRKMKLPA
jgi:hypothetical protein